MSKILVVLLAASLGWPASGAIRPAGRPIAATLAFTPFRGHKTTILWAASGLSVAATRGLTPFPREGLLPAHFVPILNAAFREDPIKAEELAEEISVLLEDPADSKSKNHVMVEIARLAGSINDDVAQAAQSVFNDTVSRNDRISTVHEAHDRLEEVERFHKEAGALAAIYGSKIEVLRDAAAAKLANIRTARAMLGSGKPGPYGGGPLKFEVEWSEDPLAVDVDWRGAANAAELQSSINRALAPLGIEATVVRPGGFNSPDGSILGAVLSKSRSAARSSRKPART